MPRNFDAADLHRRDQARQRALSVKPDVAVTTYLTRLERQGALVPGSAVVILDRVLERDKKTLRSAAYPSPPRLGRAAIDHLVNTVDFLESSAGSIYKNPLHKPEEEPELTRMARAMGLPKDEAEKLYREKAADFAGRTGPDLMISLYEDLIMRADGKYLGVTAPSPAETWREHGRDSGPDPDRVLHYKGREYTAGHLDSAV